MNTGDNTKILYKDAEVAVFCKKAGDICQLRPHDDVNSNNEYVPELFFDCLSKQELEFSHFCHCFNRLDRPVSGAVLLALKPQVIPILQKTFIHAQSSFFVPNANISKQHQVKKIYWAIIEGVYNTSSDFTLLEHYHRFLGKSQKAYISELPQKNMKKVLLRYRCFAHGDRYSFLEIELLTGRTHQIRAQLAHVGMHIKGDVKYGAKRQDTISGIRLHARELSFIHPKIKKKIHVFAPISTVDSLWQAFIDAHDKWHNNSRSDNG